MEDSSIRLIDLLVKYKNNTAMNNKFSKILTAIALVLAIITALHQTALLRR